MLVGMIRTLVVTPHDQTKMLNILYTRACVKDSLLRGEAPVSLTALYSLPFIEAESGLEDYIESAILSWMPVADVVTIYTDLDSNNLVDRIEIYAAEMNRVVERRRLSVTNMQHLKDVTYGLKLS